MLVCLLGRLIFPFKNNVGLSPEGLVRFECVKWWRQRRGRRKESGVYVNRRYFLGTDCLSKGKVQKLCDKDICWRDRVGASGGNGVDVIK
ncbi:hypothetical protein V6N13_135414 [Hibiscus sabdariffa]